MVVLPKNIKIKKAVILSAGKGKRLGTITEEVPKPMIYINGAYILEHNIVLCREFGIEEVYINIHHLSNKIKDYFGDGSKFNIKIFYNYEEELLGTAGALTGFTNLIDSGPFFVIYGDNYYHKLNLNKIYQFHINKKSKFTIQAHWKEDCSESGRIVHDKDGILVNIFEKEKLAVPKSGYVNSGIYLIDSIKMIKQHIFKGSDFAFNVIPEVLKKNSIYILKTDKKIYSVDNIELLNSAKEKFE